MTLNDQPPLPILDLVGRVRELGQRAALQYRPVVGDIVRSGNRDAQHIERTLDGLLDFCGHEPVLLMYRELCRHYWPIDPAVTAFYIDTYRERWDSEEHGGQA